VGDGSAVATGVAVRVAGVAVAPVWAGLLAETAPTVGVRVAVATATRVCDGAVVGAGFDAVPTVAVAVQLAACIAGGIVDVGVAGSGVRVGVRVAVGVAAGDCVGVRLGVGVRVEVAIAAVGEASTVGPPRATSLDPGASDRKMLERMTKARVCCRVMTLPEKSSPVLGPTHCGERSLGGRRPRTAAAARPCSFSSSGAGRGAAVRPPPSAIAGSRAWLRISPQTTAIRGALGSHDISKQRWPKAEGLVDSVQAASRGDQLDVRNNAGAVAVRARVAHLRNRIAGDNGRLDRRKLPASPLAGFPRIGHGGGAYALALPLCDCMMLDALGMIWVPSVKLDRHVVRVGRVI
jgi:hypothetical protein